MSNPKSVVAQQITYIPIKNLSVVWAQSQRPYNPKWAQEIADNFDPDMFEPLLVTKPNGNGIYHIIEGQHRRGALQIFSKNPNEQAPCRVIADADPARAAELWLGVNSGRKAVKPIHGFTVSVVAGIEPQVSINQMLIAHGYKVTTMKNKDCISAVNALQTVFERQSKLALERVLKATRMIWKGDPASVSSPMIRGLGLFMHEFGDHVDYKRLETTVGKWSPYQLSQAAEARKQSSLERLDEAIAELIFREYNKGLRESQKLKRKGG